MGPGDQGTWDLENMGPGEHGTWDLDLDLAHDGFVPGSIHSTNNSLWSCGLYDGKSRSPGVYEKRG